MLKSLEIRYCKFSSVFPKTVFTILGSLWSEVKWSESSLVMSNSLWPLGLFSPWNSPGQNTGVGHHPLLQGISQSRDRTQVSHIAGRFFTSWAIREIQLEGQEFWASLAAQLIKGPREGSLYFYFNFRISLPILTKKKKKSLLGLVEVALNL